MEPPVHPSVVDLARLSAKRFDAPVRILHVDFDDGTARWGAEFPGAAFENAETIAARFAGAEAEATEDLPIVWQSDFRNAAVLVPADRAADLRSLSGLLAVPAP